MAGIRAGHPRAGGAVGGAGASSLVRRVARQVLLVAVGTATLAAFPTSPSAASTSGSSPGFSTVGSVALPGATDVAVDPIAQRLYATVVQGTFDVLDEQTLGLITQISVSPNADSVAVDPQNSRAYVGYGDESSSAITVIDTSSEQVIGSITTGQAPDSFAVDPANHRVYVGNYFSNTVSVVDSTTDQVVSDIPTDAYPASVVLNPVTNQLFVGQQSGTVLVLDATTYQRVADIPIQGGAAGMAIDQATDRVFVPNTLTGPYAALTTVDGTTEKVAATTTTGSYPIASAYDPSHNWVYVAEGESPTLDVIDATSSAVIGTQPVADSEALAVDSSLGRLFVLSRPYDPSSSSYSWTIYAYGTNSSPAPPTTPTATTLAAAPSPASYGQTVTFTATVSPDDGAGSMEFVEDYSYPIAGCGFVGLVRSGGNAQATCTTSSLTPGYHEIQAFYSGDAGYSSSSASLSEYVGPASTTITAQPAVASLSPLGLPLFTLTARLVSQVTGKGVANELVSMTTGSDTICTATTDSQGVATCSAQSKAVTIVVNAGYRAIFAGDADYQPSSAAGGLIGT